MSKHLAHYGPRAAIRDRFGWWLERHRDGFGPISWRGWFVLVYIGIAAAIVLLFT